MLHDDPEQRLTAVTVPRLASLAAAQSLIECFSISTLAFARPVLACRRRASERPSLARTIRRSYRGTCKSWCGIVCKNNSDVLVLHSTARMSCYHVPGSQPDHMVHV